MQTHRPVDYVAGYPGEKGLVETAKTGRTGMRAVRLGLVSEAVQKFSTVGKPAGPSPLTTS